MSTEKLCLGTWDRPADVRYDADTRTIECLCSECDRWVDVAGRLTAPKRHYPAGSVDRTWTQRSRAVSA